MLKGSTPRLKFFFSLSSIEYFFKEKTQNLLTQHSFEAAIYHYDKLSNFKEYFKTDFFLCDLKRLNPLAYNTPIN